MTQFKNPEQCRNIEEIRQEIDKIDLELLKLFAFRDTFVKEIVTYKPDTESVIALERKNYVINERTRIAGQLGLEESVFRKIFTLLVEANIKKELELLQGDSPAYNG